LRGGIFFEFPGLVAPDRFHIILTEYIRENGHVIPEDYRMEWLPIDITGYRSIPAMNIIVCIYGLITSITSYKECLFLSIGIFEISSLLFVFLISKKLLDSPELSLFATLLIGMSNWYIVWGFFLVPQSLGLSIFPLIVFLILHKKKSIYYTFLWMFIYIFLILSHTVSPFITAIMIVFFFIGELLYYKPLRGHITSEAKSIGSIIPLFSLVSLITYWMFFSNFFTERVISFRANILRVGGRIMTLYPYKNYIHYEYDNLGIYILYYLAILSCLCWLNERKRKYPKFIIMTGAGGLICILYGLWIFNLQTLLPERWFPFVFILLAALSAEGLELLTKNVKQKYRPILVSLLIFFFTFFMITSGDANVDSPIIGKEDVVRYYYLESEVQAVNTINEFFRGTIYSDSNFNDYFRWVLKRNMIVANFSELETSFKSFSVLIIRKYIYERPIRLSQEGPYSRVNPTLGKRLGKINIIYSNHEVTTYAKHGT